MAQARLARASHPRATVSRHASGRRKSRRSDGSRRRSPRRVARQRRVRRWSSEAPSPAPFRMATWMGYAVGCTPCRDGVGQASDERLQGGPAARRKGAIVVLNHCGKVSVRVPAPTHQVSVPCLLAPGGYWAGSPELAGLEHVRLSDSVSSCTERSQLAGCRLTRIEVFNGTSKCRTPTRAKMTTTVEKRRV